MNTEIWQKVDALFDEYLDASPAEQANFLDEKCESAEIRQELEKLISALDKTSDFIENPTFTPVKKILDEDENDNLIGTKIYSYQIEKLLGKGGMGTVYLAKRVDDFSKEVAIKTIPPFAGSKNNKENFRRERQILAKLDHPNIARILDGGTTENGIPFLIMEYVDGMPINEYCQNLSLDEKLNLFQGVCDAVGYAHKNLVVHRDLKPTNIFIKSDGTIKLLDFGIAKLLQTDELPTTTGTTFGGNALTPEYASPEQIKGENITVSSDVYSLGVVLYELLTGNRPHNFKGKSLNEILQIISKGEPKYPNISTEIDAILLKALARKSKNRYQSTDEFRNDISNYLNRLPISARPNTAFYRLEKFVRRNKVEIAFASFFTVLLLSLFSTIIWQTFQTASQARENRRSAYSAEMILAANEYEKVNLNLVNELVQKYIPNEGEEDLRGFEWYFLKNLLNPPSKITNFIHQDEIWNVEFSPDGEFLTTVSNDNIVRTWKIQTGQTIGNNIEMKGAWKCSYFPDSKRIAVSASASSNPVAKVYEVETGKEILTLQGHQKRVRAVDVSPDGKTIATGSQDGSVRIWNAETGEELKKFDFATKEKGTEILDVQFSKNGDKLAIVGFELLAVFDTKTWQKTTADLIQFADRNINLNGWKVAFSPLEKTIAVGNWTGETILLESDKLNILRTLKNHQSNVKSLAFSADGKILATGSWDRTVKFFNVQSGDVVNELKGHFAGIHEIAFSPDGKTLATAAGDFNVNLWNAEKVFNSDAILLNGALNSFSNSGKSVVSWNSGNSEISSYDLINRQKIWSGKTNSAPLSVDVSETANRFVFGDRDGFITLFNLLNGNEIKRFKLRDKSIYGIKFSADGNQVFVSYDDGIFQRTDLNTQAEIFNIKAHENIVKPLAVSPDGKYFASGGNDKLVKIFDVSGKEIFSFKENVKPLYMVTFSDDGSLLASVGADDTARVWRVADGKLLSEFTGMSAGVFAVTFSPDSKRLATASDVGVIRLWDLENSKQVLAFTASQKQINQLKFLDDRKTLMSIDVGGKVNFWQTAN